MKNESLSVDCALPLPCIFFPLPEEGDAGCLLADFVLEGLISSKKNIFLFLQNIIRKQTSY